MKKLITLFLLIMVMTPLMAETPPYDINLSCGNTISNNLVGTSSIPIELKAYLNATEGYDLSIIFGSGIAYNTKTPIVNNISFEDFLMLKLYAGLEYKLNETTKISTILSTGIGKYLAPSNLYFASYSLLADFKYFFMDDLYIAPGIEIENTSDFFYLKTKLSLGVIV